MLACQRLANRGATSTIVLLLLCCWAARYALTTNIKQNPHTPNTNTQTQTPAIFELHRTHRPWVNFRSTPPFFRGRLKADPSMPSRGESKPLTVRVPVGGIEHKHAPVPPAGLTPVALDVRDEKREVSLRQLRVQLASERRRVSPGVSVVPGRLVLRRVRVATKEKRERAKTDTKYNTREHQ